jgi:hypothetical protein
MVPLSIQGTVQQSKSIIFLSMSFSLDLADKVFRIKVTIFKL